jgi:hypothetical protein
MVGKRDRDERRQIGFMEDFSQTAKHATVGVCQDYASHNPDNPYIQVCDRP